MLKRCSNCLEDKPLDAFYHKDGKPLGGGCKACRSAKASTPENRAKENAKIRAVKDAARLAGPLVTDIKCVVCLRDVHIKPSQVGRRETCSTACAMVRRKSIAEERHKTPRAEKKCARCRVVQPACAFGRARHSHDGLSDYCRVCARMLGEIRRKGESSDVKRARYLKHADQRRREARLWRLKNLARSIANSRRYYRENKAACAARNRAYIVANPDKVAAQLSKSAPKRREWHRASYRKNPFPRREYERRRTAKKMRARIVPFSKHDLMARLSVFGGKCAYCGDDGVAMDHVKPLSRGGPHALCNLRLSCRWCNSSKGARDPKSWLSGLAYKPARLPLP